MADLSIEEKIENRLQTRQKGKEFKDTSTVTYTRKYSAAYDIITSANLEDIEKDAVAAYKLIEKSKIWALYNVGELKEQGNSSGAAYLKVKCREFLSAKPLDSPQAREVYVKAIEKLKAGLEPLKTAIEIRTYLAEFANLDTFDFGDISNFRTTSYNYSSYVGNLAKYNNRQVEEYFDDIFGKKFHNFCFFKSDTARTIFGEAVLYTQYTKETRDGVVNSRYESAQSRLNKYQTLYDKVLAEKDATDDTIRKAIHESGVDIRGYDYKREPVLKQLSEYVSNLTELTRENISKGLNAAYTVREDDWSWSDGKKEKEAKADEEGKPRAPQNIFEKYGVEQPKVLKSTPLEFVKRTGGLDVGDISTKAVLENFGFRNIIYGNYVNDSESKEHTKHVLGAMLDLTEICNISIKDINKLGGLDVNIGATGCGAFSPAAACYFPSLKAINITKNRGDGSLGHEWSHYLDNVLAEGTEKRATKMQYATLREGGFKLKSERVDLLFAEYKYWLMNGGDARTIKVTFYPQSKYHFLAIRPPETAEAAIKKIQERSSLYTKYENSETKDLIQYYGCIAYKLNGNKPIDVELKTSASKYWVKSSRFAPTSYYTNPKELFARAFQGWLEYSMNKSGRVNNYLSNIVSSMGLLALILPKSEWCYPTDEKELEWLDDWFQRLFSAIRVDYEIAPFIWNTTERVDEYTEYKKDATESKVEASVTVTDEGEVIVNGGDEIEEFEKGYGFRRESVKDAKGESRNVYYLLTNPYSRGKGFALGGEKSDIFIVSLSYFTNEKKGYGIANGLVEGLPNIVKNINVKTVQEAKQEAVNYFKEHYNTKVEEDDVIEEPIIEQEAIENNTDMENINEDETFSYSDFDYEYKKTHTPPKKPSSNVYGGKNGAYSGGGSEEQMKGVNTVYHRKLKEYQENENAAWQKHFYAEIEAGKTPNSYQVKDFVSDLHEQGKIEEAETLLKKYGFLKGENGKWKMPEEAGNSEAQNNTDMETPTIEIDQEALQAEIEKVKTKFRGTLAQGMSVFINQSPKGEFNYFFGEPNSQTIGEVGTHVSEADKPYANIIVAEVSPEEVGHTDAELGLPSTGETDIWKMTQKEYLDYIRLADTYPQKDELWERNEKGIHYKAVKDAIEKKAVWRGSSDKSDMENAIIAGDLTANRAMKIIESAGLEIPSSIFDLAEVVEVEKPIELPIPNIEAMEDYTKPIIIDANNLQSFAQKDVKTIGEENEVKYKQNETLKMQLADTNTSDEDKIIIQKKLLDNDNEYRREAFAKVEYVINDVLPDTYFKATFSGLKCSTLDEVKGDVKSDGREQKVCVENVVSVNDINFYILKNCLMYSNKEIFGCGGTSIDDKDLVANDIDLKLFEEHIEKAWLLTPEEKEIWNKYSYNNTGMIYNIDTKEHFLYDNQGYEYARYCGFLKPEEVETVIISMQDRKFAEKIVEETSTTVTQSDVEETSFDSALEVLKKEVAENLAELKPEDKGYFKKQQYGQVQSLIIAFCEEVMPKYDFSNYLTLFSYQLTLPKDCQVLLRTEQYLLTPTKNIWNVIPDELKTVERIKTLPFLPAHTDKNLAIIVKPFVSKDDLRPNMNVVDFDENGIVAVDGHSLIYINKKPTETGLFCMHPDCFKIADKEIKEAKFPQYKDVIPVTENLVSVNCNSLLLYVNTIIKSNYIISDSGIVYCCLSLDGDASYKEIPAGNISGTEAYLPTFISFDSIKLRNAIIALMQLGYEKIDIGYTTKYRNRGAIFAPQGNIELVSKFETDFVLVMPIMYSDFSEISTDLYFDCVTESVVTRNVEDGAVSLHPEDVAKRESELATQEKIKEVKAEATQQVEKVKQQLEEANKVVENLSKEKESIIESIADDRRIRDGRKMTETIGDYSVLRFKGKDGDEMVRVQNLAVDEENEEPEILVIPANDITNINAVELLKERIANKKAAEQRELDRIAEEKRLEAEAERNEVERKETEARLEAERKEKEMELTKEEMVEALDAAKISLEYADEEEKSEIEEYISSLETAIEFA